MERLRLFASHRPQHFRRRVPGPQTPRRRSGHTCHSPHMHIHAMFYGPGAPKAAAAVLRGAGYCIRTRCRAGRSLALKSSICSCRSPYCDAVPSLGLGSYRVFVVSGSRLRNGHARGQARRGRKVRAHRAAVSPSVQCCVRAGVRALMHRQRLTWQRRSCGAPPACGTGTRPPRPQQLPAAARRPQRRR